MMDALDICMKNVLTNKQAYEGLDTANVHWTRTSDKEIVVFTSGYKTRDAYEIERYLMQAGMRCVSMEFDNLSGKTFTKYKHK